MKGQRGKADLKLSKSRVRLLANGSAIDLHKEINRAMHEETVWLRPEKFKIILAWFQIFQEFRRTYDIKWDEDLLDYMSEIGRIFDFDIF